LTGIPKRRIQGVRERMHGRRLTFARNDNARAAMGVEIIANRCEPCLHVCWQRRSTIDAADAEVRG
jgi:hypothetical protein